MTYEEAKMQIQAIPEKIWDQLSEPDREAMEMAFSALQAQDSPKPTAESVQNVQNEDLILRKAAIEVADAVWCVTGDVNVVKVWDQLKNLPSAQPERLTDDDFETIRIHLNAYKEKLCNQGRWKEAVKYQNIIDRFMAFASAQPERQWIPVSEKLPESKPEDLEYPTVIACCEDGEVMTACYYESTKEWGTGENYDKKINPVAWMPLPEPYRAERRTDDLQ